MYSKRLDVFTKCQRDMKPSDTVWFTLSFSRYNFSLKIGWCLSQSSKEIYVWGHSMLYKWPTTVFHTVRVTDVHARVGSLPLRKVWLFYWCVTTNICLSTGALKAVILWKFISMLLTCLTSVINWLIKGRTICYHIYVIMHVKGP